ncbi:IclR family transcriptional regulator [Alsobacter soli]|uniref:IclR family transcriptional regulator n=1 Tax=Alsobacter soli TaxID=2109933 RepID=A0A2T1HYL4_9HYPH|nr:IclR family transcriptional regulator [Alsobacter soli]PSC06786.1 IclR family transcriptional regulator [Alsobacter soli]
MRVVKSQLHSALDLIEAMSRAAAPAGVSDLAIQLGLPKSGVHRLLAQLVEKGWAEQDPATQRYRLTLRFALMGKRMLSEARVEDICQPILDALARETGELVRLSCVQDRRLAWLGSAQGAPPGLMYAPSMTGRIPLHATANGKAWLSTLPEHEAIAILLEEGLGDTGATGPNAMRDVEGLLAALRLTRDRGWAIALEEAEPGIVAIAAPIAPGGGVTIGAVSVAGPVQRIPPSLHENLARRVCEAAAEIADRWPMPAPVSRRTA